jgi:hypothetical protein
MMTGIAAPSTGNPRRRSGWLIFWTSTRHLT